MKIAHDLVSDQSSISRCKYDCVTGNSVYHVLVDRYLVAKGKALVMRLEKKLYRRCRLSTNTPPIPYPYSTDGSLIHCRYPTNAIAMTVHEYVDQHLTDPQPTVKCHLADELTNS